MTAERRRFYRIDDLISLSLEQIDPAQIDVRLKDFRENEHLYSMRNNYNFQIEQQIADFQKITKNMPELGRYLKVLENQIDQINERLTQDESKITLASKSANLSAQGIAYHSDESPRQGSLAELNLKLLPSGFRLVIMARVIELQTSTGDSEGTNKISLDFEHIHEADREILIKHIHNQQMKLLGSEQNLQDQPTMVG